MMNEGHETSRRYLEGAIRARVLGGYDSLDEIREWTEEAVWEELFDEEEALIRDLTKELFTFAEDLMLQRRNEAKEWPEHTRNDALEEAFDELGRRGIIALQNAGYTQSDGWDDANEIAARLQEEGVALRGATFFHGQDLESAVEGKGLHLTFGAYEEDPTQRDARSLEVGETVAETLRDHGFAIDWDGTLGQRIHTGPFPWRRRPPS